MRGLTLRVTNPTATRANLTDIVGISGVAPGETIEVLYTNDVQQSLEYGTLNTYLTNGGLTATFVSGSVLSRTPMGSTMGGATPTTDGVRGLVPRPAIADRDRFLKGDATWGGVTPFTIGAVPEAKLTTQGDLLFRGVTTSERLPLGTLGQVLRAGLVNPQWQDNTYVGTFAGRPLPDATYSGSYYWGTDTLTLYICYYNGSSWAWAPLGAGGGGVTWVGDWNVLVPYTANQAVRRLGNAYVSLTSNTGSTPETHPLDWSPMTDVGAGWDTFPTGSIPGFGADITHVGRASVGVAPASSIPAGIQFQVLGSSLYDNTFFRQVATAADQTSSTQVRAKSTDGGLYSKPFGLPERRMDLPGLTRKAIPASEMVVIPNGSQYLVSDTLTFGVGASIVLEGDAELVFLSDAPFSFLTVNGDMVFRDGTGTVTRLPVGTAGQALGSDGTLPVWHTFTASDVGALSSAILTANGDLLFRNGAGTTLPLPIGAPGELLTVSGGIPSWQPAPAPPNLPWTTAIAPTTVGTTDATPTVAVAFTTTLNKGHVLELMVSATRADRGAQAAWKILATVTNAGGVVTVRDTVSTPTDPGTVWVVSLTGAAPDVQVVVTGELATNIDWAVTGTALVHGS